MATIYDNGSNVSALGPAVAGAMTYVSGVMLNNANASAPLYFFLCNKAADPPTAATCVCTPILVPAAAQVMVDFIPATGRGVGPFKDGLVWGWSTGLDTYAAHSTVADLTTTIFYT